MPKNITAIEPPSRKIHVLEERTFSLEDPDHIDRPLYRMPFAATMRPDLAGSYRWLIEL